MHHAHKAYGKTAKEAAAPRDLEAMLLLEAAAKLQVVRDRWQDSRQNPRPPKPSGLDDAVLYNRKLWTIFIDALIREDNQLPELLRHNLLRLGVYIMAETFSLMTEPKPQHLESIIRINRGIAAGLRSKA
jgi:flagellar protein FlaF